MPANAALEQAAQQIQRFQEAMLLSAWVDRLPEVLAVVEQYNLQNCKGPGTAALQSMLDETFAAEHRQQLPVSEVPRHLAAIQSVCGKVSPVELRLFGAIQHCDAFFNFLQEQEFFGR